MFWDDLRTSLPDNQKRFWPNHPHGWLVIDHPSHEDPLDGTINFVHRIPYVAVSIGFAIDNKVVAGVIYNPILNQLFKGEILLTLIVFSFERRRSIPEWYCRLNIDSNRTKDQSFRDDRPQERSHRHRYSTKWDSTWNSIFKLKPSLWCGNRRRREEDLRTSYGRGNQRLSLLETKWWFSTWNSSWKFRIGCYGHGLHRLRHFGPLLWEGSTFKLKFNLKGIHAWDIAAGVIIVEEAGGEFQLEIQVEK